MPLLPLTSIVCTGTASPSYHSVRHTEAASKTLKSREMFSFKKEIKELFYMCIVRYYKRLILCYFYPSGKIQRVEN